jgi:hypothetical protein
MRIKFKNRILSIKLLKISKWVNGLSSLTEDNKNVIFFDFDNTTLFELTKILKQIQKKYALSDIYVFKTNVNNFHAICLDKFSFGSIIEIHRLTRGYDNKHDKHSIPRGYWVLRVNEKRGKDKPVYLKTIKSKHNSLWGRSNAHRKYLNLKYGLGIKKLNNFDCLSNIIIDTYQTIL